jgi:ATP-dependent Clp protease, protease subunit
MPTPSSPSNAIENNRIVFLSGLFDEDKAKEVITSILNLEAKDPTKDILMVIDSYGGYVHSLLAMHDVMKHISRCDIITLGIGKQMSCGQLLLISGTKGKRFVTPNSRILIHQLSAMTWGKLAEMEVHINESKKLQEILESIIVKYTKVNRKQLLDLMAKDSYISANEALELGLIDGIVKSPNDLYKNSNINL